ncbi:MAG: TauD/TfdA family dioxygenase [Pseudomonadaceae bacterium]|nr:TauD/TfdA family dioxygenase [Pseudomonadaceae bacterium]
MAFQAPNVHRIRAMEQSALPDYDAIRVEPLTGTIGAEISGVDLREELSENVMQQIRQALLDWKVIFFRDQDITTEDHMRFSAWFGELEVHPFAPEKEGYPKVLQITHDGDHRGTENIWHSDVTWRAQPSLGSVLRAIEVPDRGGDTLFADMVLAYERLDDHIKEKIDQAVARHDFSGFRRAMIKRGATDEEVAAFNAKYPNPEHPVVRTHPETGKRALYVNAAFTKEIIGMEPEESETMLNYLYSQSRIPEYQCRFRWQKNSIAFWDNRSAQHYAVSDYAPARRVVERVTIIGDTPR